MNPPLSPPPVLPADFWQRDESLRRAAELLEQGAGRVRAVSFDFFDTLVWRLVAKPADVFIEVGHRLRQQQALPQTISAEDFETLRRLAEYKVRERQKLKDAAWEDVCLLDIYRQMDAVLTDPAAGAAIECAVENDLCQVNPVIAGFIRHLRERGLRILIVSDIYLSADHLRGILRANHFDPALFETILTSSDAGVCKGSGNLFRRALKNLKLGPDELLHLGDNPGADVAGARRAGVRGCHYRQTTPESPSILDREKFLAGAQTPPFSFDSLRLLAARQFAGESAGDFFGRSGAFLLGPLLTRYATWACEQFVAAGVRKVGAFMREGEMLGALLQHESDAMGHGLEIMPLYANRKSTELAAIGQLTADNVIGWLERRQSLSVRTILEHFGLDPAGLRNLSFPIDEKAGTRERLLELAKYLFSPGIAERIEARSAMERRKIIDYLRPWIEAGTPIGVCDIGYNASAQAQLQRILELEGHPARFIGCYLVTCQRTAFRLLDGLDVRNFLGTFGRPYSQYQAFLRSPAFVEQCLCAPTGTTLGYQRAADGSVQPVLDEMRFPPELLRCQRAFKDGVLVFQNLWISLRAQKPELLGGRTDDSRRVLAGLDGSCSTTLARATAFPLPDELLHFGSLPLDDYYFAEGVKTICSPQERDLVRAGGYPRLLTELGVLWPQGTCLLDNPQVATDFFSCGKSMLLCNPTGDNTGLPVELTIIVPPQRDIGAMRECLNRLKPVVSRNPRWEIILPAPLDDMETRLVSQEFRREFKRLLVLERQPNQTFIQHLNSVVDESLASFIMIFDGDMRLAPDWDATLLRAVRSAPGVAVVFPTPPPALKSEIPAPENLLNALPRTFLFRRSAFIEGLGFNEKLGLPAAILNLTFQMQQLGLKPAFCRAGLVGARPVAASPIPPAEAEFLKRHWPDFSRRVAALVSEPSAAPGPVGAGVVVVNWIGSFLDHGSLSQVNRELAAALKSSPAVRLQRVSNGAPVAPGWEGLAREISTTISADAAVTVRHAWPPDWKRPLTGKLAVIQPWEFGFLPAQWVEQAARVDEFWVPSEYVRRVYLESGVPAAKVVVVPNGVNPDKFHPQAPPAQLATQKKFKFLFVGGTVFRKGPDLLLKAYLENFTAADDVCLVIKDFGGQGVYAGQTFEASIRAAQAQPNAPEILYLNQELPADALPGLYTACDCLVLPYRGEGFGLPALEAMACALPVIVTAGGATDDFVRDDFGWRIPAERRIFGREISGLKLAGDGWLLEPDVAALGRCLREAFADPAEGRRRGQLAARHAAQCCTWGHSAALAAQRLAALGAAARPASPETSPTGPVAKAAPAVRGKITLPPCALLGHLAEARELLHRKKHRAAWESVLAAQAQRPFHPEAFLLLAEIARSVGAGQTARLCAEHARSLVPGWKPVKKFLNQRLNGNVRHDWLKLPDHLRASGSPRLSVCLIVRNEEKFLGQCLQSIRGLAAQIVVVDTGSTDRTVEIAREHGAEVYDFVWADDFSAARNAALEHATGDWILMLDADEELSAEGRGKLAPAMSLPAVMAWRLPLVDVGREANGFTYVPRFFRNAPALFYVGRIHEQVFSSVQVRCTEWGLENRIGEATLIHHGYTAEMMRDRNKVERNLLLLERAIGEMPDEPHLLMHLALELNRSGREAEALERDQEAFDLLSSKPPGEIVPELRETLLLQFATHLMAAKQFDGVVSALTSPLAEMAGGLSASMHFSLGLAHFELRRFREAADQMRQCLAKRRARSFSLVQREIHTAAPHHSLALSLANLGETAAADLAFQEGLKEAVQGGNLRLDYARFLAVNQRPVDALRLLHEAVTRNPLDLEAWRLGGQIALSRPEFLKFARDWTAEAMKHLPEDVILIVQRAEALMLSEDLSAALELWDQLWQRAPQPTVLAGLILCELAESATTHEPPEDPEEAEVSRAFISWYRKLMAVKGHKTILRVNEQTDKLGRALPTAARMLNAAMAEAAQAGAPCA
jgi:glycosyltransferase involved in cell wall biosynthesis/FMN phosphatase YigB (HAD superfamily)/tetratricopeptide (TPR) repeat protein